MKQIKTIFLIDDDPIHQQIARKMIEWQNIAEHIESFMEADIALKYIASNAGEETKLPDMILLDLNMPVMDGWGFLEAFETLTDDLSKKIRIYILTSSVNTKDIERSKNYHSVSGYLVKPLTKDVINSLVE